MSINLLKPRGNMNVSYPMKLSERTIKLLEAYSEYNNRPVEEIVEHYLEEAFKLDKSFIKWGFSKRNNKSFIKYLAEINHNSNLHETVEKDNPFIESESVVGFEDSEYIGSKFN